VTTARLLLRFTVSERAAHWLTAASFGVMLVTGTMMPHRWSISSVPFDLHVGAAMVLVAGLAMLVLAGNRRALRRTAGQLVTMEEGDAEWLRGAPVRAVQGGEPPPAGRFNAGQKVNFVLVSLGLAGLYATGLALLVLGRGPQGPLHHLAAIAMVALIAGHVYMAVINPGTRHALRGITLGEVDGEWAAHHHPRWAADGAEDGAGPTGEYQSPPPR
jgi:formate dehydrogenase subunit gamma